MPRHLTPKEKWALFLKTISGEHSLTVDSVTDTEVSIKVANFREFQARISDPRQLQSQVIHSLEKLVGNGLEGSGASSSSSGHAHMSDLVYADFLAKMDLRGGFPDLQHFQDDPELRIASYTYTGSRGSVLAKVAGFTLLQETLISQDHLFEVLNGRARLEHNNENDRTSFAEDVIKIAQPNEHEVIVTFNYGKILQYAQAHSPDISSPIIVSEPNDIYRFDKNYLLKYLEKHLGGIVFYPDEVGERQIPIIFAPRNDLPDAANAIHEFKILMDVSGSMKEYLGAYKAQFMDIVRQIGERVENWKVTIIAFNQDVKAYKFSSETNTDTVLTVNSFFQKLLHNCHFIYYLINFYFYIKRSCIF